MFFRSINARKIHCHFQKAISVNSSVKIRQNILKTIRASPFFESNAFTNILFKAVFLYIYSSTN